MLTGQRGSPRRRRGCSAADSRNCCVQLAQRSVTLEGQVPQSFLLLQSGNSRPCAHQSQRPPVRRPKSWQAGAVTPRDCLTPSGGGVERIVERGAANPRGIVCIAGAPSRSVRPAGKRTRMLNTSVALTSSRAGCLTGMHGTAAICLRMAVPGAVGAGSGKSAGHSRPYAIPG